MSTIKKKAMSELQLRQALVAYYRQMYKHDFRITANPMSDMKLPGDWGPSRKGRFFNNAKSQGWEESAPDIIFNVSHKCGFAALSLELKKPGQNPLREYKGREWLFTNNDKKSGPHAYAQAQYLCDLIDRSNHFGTFCDNLDLSIYLLDCFAKSGPLPDYVEIDISCCKYTGKKKK